MMGDDVLLIFVLPPSLEKLKERLINRNTESIEQINKRLEIAKKEIEENDFYDYKILNDKLDESVKQMENIIKNNIN